MSASCALSCPNSQVGNALAPSEQEPFEWFAVQTRYRFEKKVAADLSHRGCEVYLPLRTEFHRWSDRHKNITIPLFPGYAFVRSNLSRAARNLVLQTAGIIGFVSFGGRLASVPTKQLEDLRLLLAQKQPFSLSPFVHQGQRVRLRDGCLRGLEGIFMKNDNGKLLISIAAVQRSIAIQVQGYELEFL